MVVELWRLQCDLRRQVPAPAEALSAALSSPAPLGLLAANGRVSCRHEAHTDVLVVKHHGLLCTVDPLPFLVVMRRGEPRTPGMGARTWVTLPQDMRPS